MLIKHFQRSGVPRYKPESLERALRAAGALLVELGGEGDGKVFHRDCAAVVITNPEVIAEPGKSTFDDFQGAILCEAWIGKTHTYAGAQRDYLGNARHKAFTSWRLEKDNAIVLTENRNLLVSDDSLWPGAIWIDDSSDQVAIATSALMPEQDEWISRFVYTQTGSLLRLGHEADRYRSIYPPRDKDTFGGKSFDLPPSFSGFN